MHVWGRGRGPRDRTAIIYDLFRHKTKRPPTEREIPRKPPQRWVFEAISRFYCSDSSINQHRKDRKGGCGFLVRDTRAFEAGMPLDDDTKGVADVWGRVEGVCACVCAPLGAGGGGGGGF